MTSLCHVMSLASLGPMKCSMWELCEHWGVLIVHFLYWTLRLSHLNLYTCKGKILCESTLYWELREQPLMIGAEEIEEKKLKALLQDNIAFKGPLERSPWRKKIQKGLHEEKINSFLNFLLPHPPSPINGRPLNSNADVGQRSLNIPRILSSEH